MSTALSSRQRLLQQRTVVHRRSFASGKAAQRLWIRPTPFYISTRCKAGVEPSVTTGATPSAPAAPAAGLPQYAQPGYVPAEYVAQTEQPGLAPPARPQEYYMAPPPPPMYPAPVYREAQAASGLPWFIWVGVGILGTTAIGKISEVVKKGPQQMMAEMAMKQMMSSMQNQSGGAGASPFGGAPGSPFGAAGANPFGAAGANPYAGNPFAGFTPPTPNAPVDTTATTASAAAAPASSAASSSSRGDKFSQRISQETRPDAASPMDVVEPVVKEPPPMGTATTSSSPPKPAFFQDVDPAAAAAASAPPPPSASAGATTDAGAATGSGDQSAVTLMMEKMLRNPEMQKMLYPYLPEPMRNPDSIEWMLNNPEVKSQMEKMLAEQGFDMPPQMLDMMKNMDLSEDKVNQQFQQLGMKPEDVMQKIMASPEIATGFTNPRVQQAIMDISSNPMNIVKYQNDAEVMRVLEKVNEIFAPGMGGMPGMPPGMPVRPPGA